MLLWVLSCLYENKNNLRASASAQPLPKDSACTRGHSPALHPPKCNVPGPRPLPVPRGWEFLTLEPTQTGICAYSRGYLNGAATADTHTPCPPCNPWAPLSLTAPSPVPPVLCPCCHHEPQTSPGAEDPPHCPSPAQPWQKVLHKPTKEFPVPGRVWAGRARATLRPQVCIGCNKAE